MGRLIAVVLFIAVLVPGVLLARAWWLASGRRAVAGGSVELAESTTEGAATLRRQAQHGRRILDEIFVAEREDAAVAELSQVFACLAIAPGPLASDDP